MGYKNKDLSFLERCWWRFSCVEVWRSVDR